MNRLSHPAVHFLSVLFLAGITLGLHDWNRITHHTVSMPTPEEVRLARLAFTATLSVTYGALLVLAWWRGQRLDIRRAAWPWKGVLTLAIGVVLGLLAFTIEGIGGYQDLLAVFLAYSGSLLACANTTIDSLLSWRAKSWAKGL